MQVAKSFVRNGQRYRPGDDAPAGLDGATLAHYQRHGMLREPEKSKPRASRARAVAPSQKQEAAPEETKDAADLLDPATADSASQS